MYSKSLKHLKFLFTSTNQHGVHSPFIYNYLTKCLYLQKIFPKSRTIDVLLKSISYFEFKNLRIAGNDHIKAIVSQKFPEASYEKIPLDLIYTENLRPNLVFELVVEGKIHNDSMLLINSIHKNKGAEQLWNKTIADERAMVTLDLFYCGVIFFRKEQVKEHFKIRI